MSLPVNPIRAKLARYPRTPDRKRSGVRAVSRARLASVSRMIIWLMIRVDSSPRMPRAYVV